MHRAMTILEVVEEVCYYLSTGTSSRNALALAVTCKILHNPALNSLWKTQKSIIPLLSCLPDDLFNKRPNLSDDQALVRCTIVLPYIP